MNVIKINMDVLTKRELAELRKQAAKANMSVEDFVEFRLKSKLYADATRKEARIA